MRRAVVLPFAPLALLALSVPAAATPSPAPAPTRPPTTSCPGLDIVGVQSDHRVGGVTTVTARRYGGPEPTRMTLTRTRPDPVRVVREQSDTATTVTWTLRLGETHALQVGARYDRTDCVPLGRPDQMPVTVGIRAAVTLEADRAAPRDYTFSGTVVPARGQQVSLFRVEADGRRVLTSRSTVQADGTYRVDRRFAGSGRFGFVVTVPTTSANDAGSSRVRPTVVH